MMKTNRLVVIAALATIAGTAWAAEPQFTKGPGGKLALSATYPPLPGDKACRVVTAPITSDLQDIVVGTCINGQTPPTEGVPDRQHQVRVVERR